MTTHDFPEAVKVQRFCLTLVGEAKNWYATLEPLTMTWPESQNLFRWQNSKIGNMREQLFHMLGGHSIMMRMWKPLMHTLLE